MADELDPSAKSSDYEEQEKFWAIVSAILGGEAAIKAGATNYLPKFAKEKQEVYDYRLANAPFTNIYADISKNLASKPFAKPLALKEGTSDQYLKLAENIDGQGNNHHVFASAAFKAALDKGIDWIFVDYTKAKPRADGRPLSKTEEAEQGLRPYWVHIPAERMLAVYSDFVGGVEVIHHARISETSKQVDGFDETTIERVRVLNRIAQLDEFDQVIGYEPATWELWEHVTDSDNKQAWVVVGGGPITIGVIPLVPVVLTQRNGGSWVVDPPIRDLAHLQIKEYRQESNLSWVEIMTTFPMICVSGMPTENSKGEAVEVTVGPNTVFLIPQNSAGTGPAGEVDIVEPTGAATTELRTSLELTRKEMRDLGMQPMTQSALTVVTTANISKKASSAVQAWAYVFQDAIEQAWKLTARWLGDKSFEPEVIVHTDFAVEIQEGRELDILDKGRARGDISRDAWAAELQRRDVLSADYDVEADSELIAKEQEGLEGEEGIDPRTGRPLASTT